MSSHAALTVSPRERASTAKPSAPSAAIAPQRSTEPSRRMGGSYGSACRASNSNIGSNSLAPYSWTLASREAPAPAGAARSEEHTSELQSRLHLVCRLLLEKKKKDKDTVETGQVRSNDYIVR